MPDEIIPQARKGHAAICLLLLLQIRDRVGGGGLPAAGHYAFELVDIPEAHQADLHADNPNKHQELAAIVIASLAAAGESAT